VSESTGFLYRLLPWNFITRFHEGVVIQKDGILQRTFAYRAPDVDSSGAAEVNGLSLMVNDFAKRLGAGWAVHFEAQRFYTREYPRADFTRGGASGLLAPYLIDREREAAFRAAGRHFESSYYLTFSWRPPSENVKKLIGMFVRSGGGDGGPSVKENVAFFVNETNAVAGVLANGMLLAPLSNEETAAYLHSCVSLNRHPLRFPVTRIMLDRILPDSGLVTSLTMKLGRHYIPLVGVCDFPEETYPAILDGLNRARLEYRWVSRYICLGKEEGKKEARKKEKSHRGNRKTFLQTFAETTSGEASASVNHGAGVKEADSIDAGIEIETDQAALGYLTTCVMVWDTDLKAAAKKADTVKAVINAAGFTCKEETFNALEAWMSMMPGQVYANYRALPVMSYSLSHVVPLSSVWAGTRRNGHAGLVSGVDLPHLVCSTAEGTPFFLNLNPGDTGHSAVWGPTGSGKSTLLNLLETQFFKYPGSRVVVFDKGRSCRLPCLASGGLFYEPAGENAAAVSLQPLRDLETDRALMDAADFIEACVTVNGYEVPPPMRAAIKESLELLREKPVSARTITSFLQYANYTDPQTRRPVLNEMLGDYLWDGGKYGKIFDARASSISLDTRFLAIEMEALMNRGRGCVEPALVYLFNLVETMFDGRLTLLVLDEAWLFLKNETFAGRITEWLKVLRKKNVFVVFATQDVADVGRSPLRTTVIQQCLTKIYLADPSASAPGMIDAYRDFGLTDAEIGLISGAVMKRDYFYTSPLGRRLFRLDLGPVTLGLVGRADHDALDRAAAAKGRGVPLCADILNGAGIDYRHLLGSGAPREPEPAGQAAAGVEPEEPVRVEEAEAGIPAAPKPPRRALDARGLLDAVKDVPERKRKDGSGRAAAAIARRFSVSQATVYQARRILREGNAGLLDAVKQGEISIKTACNRLDREKELKGAEQAAAV
jgi:type IV secretion system protein VirB4